MRTTLILFLHKLSSSVPDLPFQVRFWDAELLSLGNGRPRFTLTISTPAAARRVIKNGALGFGEAYIAGEIDVEGDFLELMRLGTSPDLESMKLPIVTRVAGVVRNRAQQNTLRRSRKNIAHHYSRGNEFYQLYLDESLTYSCAYYKSPTDSLEQAQQQKYEHVCRKLQLKADETLVDVGCGWGGMLEHAAGHYGVRATGCTLSRPQYDYAVEHARSAGLEGRVSVLLEDYRNLKGTFDKFVSVGMFEHVGKKFIPTFMDKARALLKPGGLGLLHSIGNERPTPMNPWTTTYIFPGGYIPVLEEMVGAMGRAGLVPLDVENLRLHYALTLEEWSRRFESNADRIRNMFNERFVRTWRMFLLGSAAGFRWGNTRLYQVVFSNGLNNSLPLTRDHLYEGSERTG